MGTQKNRLNETVLLSTRHMLTLKAPITTAADNKFFDIFPNDRKKTKQKKQGMMFHENRLPADDPHEISCLIFYFEKAARFEIVVCCKL